MITEALFQIQEDMERLRAAMRAKGHHKASAQFRVENDGRYCIHLDTEVRTDLAFRPIYGKSAYVYPLSDTYAGVLTEAEEAIAAMAVSAALAAEEEAKACEAWFQMEAA